MVAWCVLLLLGAVRVNAHALVGLKADNGQHIAVISVSILLPSLASPRPLDMITARLLCTALRNQSVFSFFCLNELEEENHVIKKVILFWMPRDHNVDYLEFRLL